jgi:hypothetical protein
MRGRGIGCEAIGGSKIEGTERSKEMLMIADVLRAILLPESKSTRHMHVSLHQSWSCTLLAHVLHCYFSLANSSLENYTSTREID